MFCRSYSCKLQQPTKTERKLRKPKQKPPKYEKIWFHPGVDNIGVATHKNRKYRTYYLDSVVPSLISSHPEFITWREKALITRKLKEEELESLNKPEYTKQDFNKQSKYRRVSSVYSSSLRPKSANEAIYESIFSEY